MQDKVKEFDSDWRLFGVSSMHWRLSSDLKMKKKILCDEKPIFHDHFVQLRRGVNKDAATSTITCPSRSIEGFGLSPGVTKEQRLKLEGLMKTAFSKFEGDLSSQRVFPPH